MRTLAPARPEAWRSAYPRTLGDWTVRLSATEWARYDPDRRMLDIVDPAADPALPALGRALQRGVLVGYRVGRRAVVATPTSYIKVVRPRKLERTVAAHLRLAESSLAMRSPLVLDYDTCGAIELSVVAGPSLHELMRARGPESRLIAAISQFAEPLAELHRCTPAPADSSDAIEDPHLLVASLARHDASAAHRLATGLSALPELPRPRRSALVHGDLHDKNVVHGPERSGLIDLDALRAGAPEDDVANLAVHLELRALQAGHAPDVGRARSRALYDAYGNHRRLDPARVDAVERHTWFRLAHLYSCRPRSAALVPELLARVSGNR